MLRHHCVPKSWADPSHGFGLGPVWRHLFAHKPQEGHGDGGAVGKGGECRGGEHESLPSSWFCSTWQVVCPRQSLLTTENTLRERCDCLGGTDECVDHGQGTRREISLKTRQAAGEGKNISLGGFQATEAPLPPLLPKTALGNGYHLPHAPSPSPPGARRVNKQRHACGSFNITLSRHTHVLLHI